MNSQFFELASEQDARERCPHIAKALDVLQQEYGIVVRQVGWQNWKDPELIVTLNARVRTVELEAMLGCASLCFDHQTFSFHCTEHQVEVWSGI